MGASALVILFGTSWPILSHASLEPAFYDKTNLPIAIALGLLLALSLAVQWKEESSRQIVQNSIGAIVAAVTVLVLLVVAGLRDIMIGLLAFASLFAFFVNVVRLYRLSREDIRFTGGPLAHIGLAVLFLGIIGSGRYGEKKTASLPSNQTKEVLGYQLTYTGSKPMPDGKWRFSITVNKDGSQFVLDPVMFQSEYNNSLMRNPDYSAFLTRDFYIEPVSLEESSPTSPTGGGTTLELKKGESKASGDVTVTFVRFEMNHTGMESPTGTSGITIGAVLEVKRGDSKEQVIPVTVYKGKDIAQAHEAKTKDGTIGFQLIGMNVDSPTKGRGSTIELNVTGLGGPASASQRSEILIIEASVKPFMKSGMGRSTLDNSGIGFLSDGQT